MMQLHLRLVAALTILQLPLPGFASEELFEKSIRPVLQRCTKCHRKSVPKGGVRLDGRSHINVNRLRKLVSGKSQAPAVCQLKPRQARDFTKWIASGLIWPRANPVKPNLRDGKHWAFVPMRRPPVPKVSSQWTMANPIDAFVFRRLGREGLQPSPPASRRRLIRRLYYSAIGLPPTPAAVDAFVQDRSPRSYERLVKRLLATPAYGEHWARHWLDVARYSDTKGYVYGREERFWAHAWAYRDWVVSSLNRDLPYNRFLQLQIAGDQLVDKPTSPDLAAMGFLTLGRRFQGIETDIIDDRIDVVTRGTMALTVSCARCHDHMYDPIPTADYYSLFGVFASSQEELVSLDGNRGGPDFQRELAKKRKLLHTTFLQLRKEASQRSRQRVADYLFAQTELEKYPADDFDQIFYKKDLLPGIVHHWHEYLRQAEQRKDRVFLPWLTYAKLPQDSFADAARSITFKPSDIHPLVAREFQRPPKSMRDVADRYGRIFQQHQQPGAEALRQVLFGPRSAAEVPDLPIVHSQRFFDTDSVTKLYRLEGDVQRLVLRAKTAVPVALMLKDRRVPITPRIFVRGNPVKRGEAVPRRFLAVLSGKDRVPFRQGSGRLELARAITDPKNPLTARVIVNRVWAHHFGRGLVETLSDFGLRSKPPSHPDLLDWLATRFIADGWSLKKLHRLILLSNTFQQASIVDPNDRTKKAMSIDPDNRLLWRMSPRRLTWEQFRDSMLRASDDLNPRIGGKPVNLFSRPYPKRRTLYGLIDRQFLPGLLRTFDFANPDLHIAKRSETTVPQQALFFLNDPLVLSRVRALARYVRQQRNSTGDQIRLLFRRVWQRSPSQLELAEAKSLLQQVESRTKLRGRVTAQDWQYGHGAYQEKTQRVVGFKRLPHFTGDSWQGGPSWPDQALGWVRLTATGGHPGNTRNVACIRRWTAPRAMNINISSRLIHQPKDGDGIRAFIVSSRSGLLSRRVIHRQTVEMNVAKYRVQAGETIDFIVDIGKGLNNDQYLWSKTIRDTSARKGKETTSWNSRLDFTSRTRTQLTGLEQLAQALICSNEFLFVD